MLRVGISYDPGELRDLERRIDAARRAIGGRRLDDQVAVLAERENERASLAGLDRHGQRMRPWRTRRGDSDYHGEDYASWTNATVLVPFGRRSRRINAFLVRPERSGGVLGFGGKASYFVGFTARAGRVPAMWARQGRDVLGLPPRTRRGLQLLLTQHTSASHGLLRRGRRAAASLLGF